MFRQKNGAAQPQQPGSGAGIPAGVQMFLKSLGFDPVALFAQIETMMKRIAATELRFGVRLDAIGADIEKLRDIEATGPAAIAAVIMQALDHHRKVTDAQFLELSAQLGKVARAVEEVKQWTEQSKRRK